MAHDLCLFANLDGERAAIDIGFVDDDAERRLERMREVADLRAGALDDLVVGGDQQIEFAGERGDVVGEVADDAIGIAAANRGDALLQAPQWAESEPHL